LFLDTSLRSRIKRIPVLGTALESTWRAITGRRDLAYVLVRSRILPADACLVKIGANDGYLDDPTAQLLRRRPAMRCVFVEPVPQLLSRARQRWGTDPRFNYVQAAINDGSAAEFYYVDDSAKAQLPDLHIDPDQLGSFDRQHILKHPDGERLAPFIRSLAVEGMSLDALLQVTKLTRLDILHVDAEGWDWRILSQLDLNRWQPAYILFEHIHLTEEERDEAKVRLSPGYDLEVFGTDWLWTRKTSAGARA
jgi:FkbM family methyltransferase